MPSKSENTMAMVMAMQPSHHLLYVKSRIMKKVLDDPDSFMTKSVEDKEQDLLMKGLIEIEIIATTVHYAEVFASRLIAMKKYKRLQKYLLEYEVKYIKEFYKNIKKRRSNYIANLLHYPPVHLLLNKERKKEFQVSIQDIHFELNKLSDFYLKWYDFYNSYKHGFRVFASKPNPYEDSIFAGHVNDSKKLNSFMVMIPSEDIEKALGYCSFMLRILDETENIFVQRKIRKEKKVKMKIFSKKH